MTTKEYLNKLRTLDRQIDSKLEQIDRLRSLSERVTTTISFSPKGAGYMALAGEVATWEEGND